VKNQEVSTNHPFIVKREEICAGSPIIEGTRTRVIDIVVEYEMHDALSYYYENQEELDRKILEINFI